MENYYFDRLDKKQKIVYKEMKDALQDIKSSFLVERLSGEQLKHAFDSLMYDHPEIYYCLNFKYRFYPDSSYFEILPDYSIKKDKIIDHNKMLSKRIERIVNGCKENEKVKILKYFHDYICTNVKYDKLKKYYSHQIIGPLTNGIGVCEGISKTFKILCQSKGIECICVVSDNNLEKNIKYRHMWNIVKIDNQFYHIDCTFDLSLSGDIIRYDYFLVNDKLIFKDHEQLLNVDIKCIDNSKYYYHNKKVQFANEEELECIVKKKSKKKESFILYYSDGVLTKQVLKQVIETCEKYFSTIEKKGTYLINAPQGIIQCNICDFVLDKVKEQNPNESEE